MTFKEKVLAFVAKHGYTYRSYVLSILFLPPAAVYIAWKKPNLPMAGRLFLGATAIVAPPFIGGATLVMLKTAFDVIRTTFLS